MNWIKLESIAQLEDIKSKSEDKPQIIFKHSTTCSISAMAKSRLERSWKDEEMAGADFYYLDLLSYRDISNEIADKFHVRHESPQVIIVKGGASTYDNSHMGISYQELLKEIS